MLPITDDQLVVRVANGDAAALATLYDRYVRQCFGLALRLVGDPQLAEEIVQEVFLKLWAQPTRYSPQKGQFVSWLLSLVHHRSIDELRRRSRTEVALDTSETQSLLDTEASDDPDPGDQVWLAEMRQTVRQALAGIPENQRQVRKWPIMGGCPRAKSRPGWASRWAR